MTRLFGSSALCGMAVCLLFAISGCGGSGRDAADAPASETAPQSASAADAGPGEQAAGGSAPHRTLQPIRLGGGSEAAGGVGPTLSDDEKLNTVREALQPLQVVLGRWEGKTRRQFDGFAAVETVDWVWDFRTDRTRPALVMASDKSPYFESARLTWLIDEQQFQLTAVDREGTERVYRGTFSEPVRDVTGDDNKPQRTFKLELTQVSPEADRKLAQLVFNQQDNARYLLEVYDRTGSSFRRSDTVANQRDGTSFALSDTDYGERECIISQGLGTMSVSYKGKTYWVCCTGCKAAFEEEPERWIAKRADESSR